MNTRPSIDDLVEGLSLTLERTIIPALDDSGAREQATLMLGVLQRLAGDWDRLGPLLYADNERLEADLRELMGTVRLGFPDVAAELQGRLEKKPYRLRDYPTVGALADWHRTLKELVAWLTGALGLPGEPGDAKRADAHAAIRALLRAMLEREIASAPPAATPGRA